MARFHPLTVTAIHRTIRDAVAVTLAPPADADFSFTQGQYLTFRRQFDGAELRRSYSVCAAEGDALQVGIKRVEGGTFSTWANTELRVGDVIEAMPPMGKFHAGVNHGKRLLFFAGGSGITPILSILRTTLRDDPDADCTLVYANRAINTIMFREDLEELKNTHLGRFTLIHILESDAQDIDLFTGRVDAEKCAALFTHWIDLERMDTAFICGPEPMMLTISEALQQNGLAKDQIRFELFASGQPGRAKRPAASATIAQTGAQATITLDGAAREITIAPGDTVLDAALAADLDAPFSCRAGVCSTCRARVTEGETEMIANHALEDYEVAQGYVLTCQCLPRSPVIRLVYDH
ncbi:ring-1,2-phenylacetyl-CoA epoxidase subunit PaaE [Rubricella aquisinus]|uniref:Ring-1,2-phenylacetyl-CoA epoxidase subunit PaaE n=1 Tax=Rubricella aquisinus TaxID=2028108 RepID=A0A840WSK7_9RHOB|nr:2Fe-2S iron-sulfur cluster-binding protein [Rubricella aquisinus]MBB5514190.1 ring-1,2-phenylacetyl-CoA epoxidase subunit PaaE [Rubricella aquisinus]